VSGLDFNLTFAFAGCCRQAGELYVLAKERWASRERNRYTPAQVRALIAQAAAEILDGERHKECTPLRR
jgi:hypothetical protein